MFSIDKEFSETPSSLVNLKMNSEDKLLRYLGLVWSGVFCSGERVCWFLFKLRCCCCWSLLH